MRCTLGIFVVAAAASCTPTAPPRERPIIEFAIAPDGQRLAFTAADAGQERRLWVRALMTAAERPIAGSEGAAYPFWSSDSRFIAFFADGALRKVAADGGVPSVIAAANMSLGGAWHDDMILFAAGPIYRVPASGGTAAAATTLHDGEASHTTPVFLPDGRRFLYTATRTVGEPRVFLGSLESADRQEVLSDASGVALADGFIVYLRSASLHVQPFDIGTLTPRGDAIPVSDGAPSAPGSDGVRAFSLSTTGILAYQRGPAPRSTAGEGNIAGPVTLVDWRSTVQP